MTAQPPTDAARVTDADRALADDIAHTGPEGLRGFRREELAAKIARHRLSTRQQPEAGSEVEAMREAAAKVCGHVREIIGASTGSSIAMALAEASDRIRALPLPAAARALSDSIPEK